MFRSTEQCAFDQANVIKSQVNETLNWFLDERKESKRVHGDDEMGIRLKHRIMYLLMSDYIFMRDRESIYVAMKNKGEKESNRCHIVS